ncbi:MAG TPA: diacylglycerol kinase family protein [Bacillales bacterium]|nr:diacylglycerol kinase family protein [Bacillales bacterium]
MGSNDKRAITDQFRWAISGMKQAFLAERNLRIHVAAAVVVMAFAFVFHVSYMEKLVLLIVIGLVISLEIVNTAVERAVDLATADEHPLAKLAKDIAAAAVLFSAGIAVIVGLAIFLPYLFCMFGHDMLWAP